MLAQLFAQASNQTTSPWWGVPLVTGSFAIGGVALGGLIAYLAALFTDKRRTKREDKHRWDNEIKVACSRLLSASHRIDSWLTLYGGKATSKSYPEEFRLFRATMDDFFETYYELHLIATEPIARAARDFADKANILYRRREDADLWRVDYQVAFVELVRIVREKFGVEGGVTEPWNTPLEEDIEDDELPDEDEADDDSGGSA